MKPLNLSTSQPLKDKQYSIKPNRLRFLWHNSLLVISLFLFMIITSSCNKDSEMSDEVVTDNLKVGTKERQEQIIEFLEIVKQKDVDLISRSSPFNMKTKEAIPFLEESLNLGFCRLDSSFYEDYYYAYDTIFIPVSNDSISSATLTDAFDSIAHFAATEYGNRSVGSRQSILFGLNTDYVLDTILNGITVSCLYVVAEDIGTAYKSGDYDEDDYWLYCCEGGKCGPYSGGQPNDAVKILTKDLKKELVPPLYKKSHYFIEHYSICFAPPTGDCWDPNSNTQIIYNENIEENQALWFDQSDCMTPSDLSYHYSAMLEMINDNQPFTGDPPNLKSVVAILVLDDLLPGVPPTYVHKSGVSYGTLVELEAEAPAPLDLTEF